MCIGRIPACRRTWVRERSDRSGDREIRTRSPAAYDPGMLLVAALLAVTLASPFGSAQATAIDDSDGLTIEVDVAVVGTWVTVLARPFSSFEELPPTALFDRGDGTWGGEVRLPSAEDWSIAFDAIDPDGETERSDSATLTALGVDPVVVDAPPHAPVPSRPIPVSTWWLVAGIVLALAALGALAWWTFSGPGGAEPTAGTSSDEGSTSP